MVQVIKYMFKKKSISDSDASLALHSLRNTPISGLEHIPLQLLLGRFLCSTLPDMLVTLSPRLLTSVLWK